jgi:hypothetical protein
MTCPSHFRLSWAESRRNILKRQQNVSFKNQFYKCCARRIIFNNCYKVPKSTQLVNRWMGFHRTWYWQALLTPVDDTPVQQKVLFVVSLQSPIFKTWRRTTTPEHCSLFIIRGRMQLVSLLQWSVSQTGQFLGRTYETADMSVSFH